MQGLLIMQTINDYNSDDRSEIYLTLEDYLQPNEKVTKFLEDNSWWDKLQVTAQIPLEYLKSLDSTYVIVGKEKEIEIAKVANWNAAQLQTKRVERFNDLRMLFIEVDYIKKHRLIKKFNEKNQELREEYSDWELRFNKIISDFEEEGLYNGKKAHTHIFNNFERTLLGAEIDYERIAAKMSQEFSTSPIVTYEGPMGSGKSFIQKILMEDFRELCRYLRVEAFEHIALRDTSNPDKGKLIKLVEGEGRQV